MSALLNARKQKEKKKKKKKGKKTFLSVVGYQFNTLEFGTWWYVGIMSMVSAAGAAWKSNDLLPFA